jgi:hypothetical protein
VCRLIPLAEKVERGANQVDEQKCGEELGKADPYTARPSPSSVAHNKKSAP